MLCSRAAGPSEGVERMQWLIIARDGKDEQATGAPARGAPGTSRECGGLQAKGHLLIGGALVDDDGNMIGSAAVAQFATRAELDHWLRDRPLRHQRRLAGHRGHSLSGGAALRLPALPGRPPAPGRRRDPPPQWRGPGAGGAGAEGRPDRRRTDRRGRGAGRRDPRHRGRGDETSAGSPWRLASSTTTCTSWAAAAALASRAGRRSSRPASWSAPGSRA